MSDGEATMLREALIEMNRENSWWGQVLDFSVSSASFGVELGTTGGIATATKKGALELAGLGLRRLATVEGRQQVERLLLTRLALGTVGLAGQTATASLSHVMSKAYKDSLHFDEMEMMRGRDGKVIIGLEAGYEPGSMWDKLPAAFVHQMVENGSEKMGAEKMGAEKAGRYLAQANARLAKLEIQGIPQEIAEEYAAALGHTVFEGEEFSPPGFDDITALMASMVISRGGSMVVDGVMGRDGRGSEGQMPGEVGAPGQVLEGGTVSDVGVLKSLEGSGEQGTTAVNAEAGANAEGRLSFSGANASQGKEDVNALSETFQSLATDDTFRRGPAVADKDLNAIMQTMASRVDKPETVVVGPNAPRNADIARSYVVTVNDGGEVVVNVETNGTVWVDTFPARGGKPSRKAQGGDLIYQAVHTYAHNNGLTFVPDPRGVEPIAQRRRISHMISSALRHRTTRHFNPYHADETYNGELPNRSEWREEKNEADFKHNLDLLLRAEMNYVASEMAARGKSLDDLRYDPDTDTVWQKQGGSDGRPSDWRQLSEDDYAALITGLDPGRSGIGETTLARALLAKVRLERHESGIHRDQYFRGPTLDGRRETPSTPGSEVFRLLGPTESPRKLFYSRGEATSSERVQRTGVTLDETTAAETRLKSTAQGRAIYGNVLIVDNRAQLDGLQGRPGQQRYHAEDWDIMHDAEGFHDPRDGTVVIFRDNVRVLEGETAAQALARVVVHERVGHHGFDALRESDSKFAEEWSKLAAVIPADQMKQLEARYTHLNGNRDALALEWFAHQVGNMEGRAQLQPGSVAQRMWQAMRDWVVRKMQPLGDPSKEMSQEVIDAHVRGLIRATRRGMVQRAGRNSTIDRNSNTVTASSSAIQNQDPTDNTRDDLIPHLQSRGNSSSESGNSRTRWIRGKYRPPQHVGKHYVRDIPSLLNALGVSDIKSHVFTMSEVSRMLGLLVKSNPADVSTLVSEVDQNATFTRGQLLDIAQSFINLLPDRVTDLLKAQPVSIRFDRSLGPTEFGGYSANVITFNPHMVTSVSSMYRNMYHELMHWVHEHGPAEYRDTIRTLMHTRTNGFTEPMEHLHQFGSVPYDSDVMGMRDDFADQFGDEYPGRIYPKELRDNRPQGSEIPSVHLEKLAYHPRSFADYLNHRSLKTGKYAWREALFESLTIFF